MYTTVQGERRARGPGLAVPRARRGSGQNLAHQKIDKQTYIYIYMYIYRYKSLSLSLCIYIYI